MAPAARSISRINGTDRTGPLSVPNTGGWQTWVTIRKTGLSLSAGQQVWRVVLDSNGSTTAVGNLNYFRVVAASGTTNPPPTVSITSPANGTSQAGPANFTINATASDSNGTVSRVDFYAGGTLLGSDASRPYSFNWTAVAAGSYSLTAVAVDNGGASGTSGAVNVTVSRSGLDTDDRGVQSIARSRLARVLVHGCAVPPRRPGHGDAGRDEEPREAVTGQQRDLGVHHRHRQPVAGRLVLRCGHSSRVGRLGAELAVGVLHEMS